MKKITKKQVEKELYKWLDLFGISPIRVVFFDEQENDENTEGFTLFSIRQKYPYRTIEFTTYPETWNLNPSLLPLYMVHEVMHLVMWRMTRDHKTMTDTHFLEAEEDICDRVALAIYNLKNA